jgi:hypothetical protein
MQNIMKCPVYMGMYIHVEHNTIVLKPGMRLRVSTRVETPPDFTGMYTKKMRVCVRNIIKN